MDKKICPRELVDAINDNNIERARYYLSQKYTGVDECINRLDENDNTLLYLAALQKNNHMIKMLLEMGADVNAVCEQRVGQTVLHTAAAYTKDISIMKMLLDAGASVDACDDNSWTPLIAAITTGELESVRVLLEVGADTNKKEEDGMTSLMMAISCYGFSFYDDYKHSFIPMIQSLIHWGADVNAVNHKGHTPLYFALKCSSDQIVVILLDNGACVDHYVPFWHAPSPITYVPPLRVAVAVGYIRNVEVLLQHGANPHFQCSGGKTALDIAKSWANRDEIAIILEQAMNPIHA